MTAKDTGEVWFETGQSHVTALTLDKEGRLLAGTEPNGLIYRLDGKDKAFVLYDSNFPEIRTLATAPDGTVYAAALGGTVQQRTNAAGADAVRYADCTCDCADHFYHRHGRRRRCTSAARTQAEESG